MAQFTLTALPSRYEQEPDGSRRTRLTEIMGACFGHTRSEARTVADVRALVASFGFDAASLRGSLGQDAWMRTFTKGQPALKAASI